ncbi:flavin reductase family protein [Chelatococcus asaccharovorans]|uniref:flavin reductase family protein n=1 Tax=Chelatococcus asaccharovorans TaxID=28210 RepID=UPI00224C7453|nr:flavin reductase family protein [Chelatococcus asaccharovorans]CAH1663873.1 Nitrilotriacetate monooxygenase component B [Chelatococcus asaccharovorans]CAH1682615.1 Nitrilotriacetate monooxygenase component B [Chelatococcus asaccharovorans]
MLFDMEALPAQDRYKILTATIVPRPIAWITTLSRSGIINAAPFSFFNMMGNDPPTVAIGIMPQNGRLKDTAANILETGEFVVNLVAEANAEAMNETCIDAPPEVDELALAGLTPLPSHAVQPPRISEAPVALECKVLTSLVTGPLQTIVIGRVLNAHIDDRFIIDAERRYIDTLGLKLIARLHASGGYLRSTDHFQMERPSWESRRGKRHAGAI